MLRYRSPFSSSLGPELPAEESRTRRRFIRVVALGAIAVTLVYLIWRTLFTLNLSAWWVAIPLLLLEFHALVGLGLFTFSLWDVDSLPASPKVGKTNHRLAVLIPTYNESEEVLLPTVAAAVAMELPHETWVLDDGDRGSVKQLAEALGAQYLARPGHDHAKAGNLNHALEIVEADLVAILDADHVPDPEFLTKTLGYFDDPTVAVVQTPQDFYNVSSFEHATGNDEPAWSRQAAHEETLFYRVIQPGKNRWDAAFWCGTNAVVRVAALREVGGVSTDTVTEDIHTTVRLQRLGWRIRYHNEVLALGLAAADAGQFRLQRHRWATGGMQLLRSDNPLTMHRLTVPQRLSYAATLFGWFDSWRTAAFLLLPPVVLFTGASPIRAPLGVFLAAFTVSFAFQQMALRLLARGNHHPIASARFELMRLGSTLNATLTLLSRRPRPFRVTPKGRMSNQRTRIRIPIDLRFFLLVSCAAALWFGLSETGVTGLHYGTPGVAWGALVWLAVNGALVASAARWIHSEHNASELRRAVRFPMAEPASLDGQPCTVLDCSMGGARIEFGGAALARRALVGTERHRLDIRLAGATLPIDTKVRSLRETSDHSVQAALEFGAGQLPARAALATVLFHGSTAPVFDDAIELDQRHIRWRATA